VVFQNDVINKTREKDPKNVQQDLGQVDVGRDVANGLHKGSPVFNDAKN
jgi:hypothetical protein